jgi:hypothetical protein
MNMDTPNGPMYRAWKAKRDAEIELDHLWVMQRRYLSARRVLAASSGTGG